MNELYPRKLIVLLLLITFVFTTIIIVHRSYHPFNTVIPSLNNIFYHNVPRRSINESMKFEDFQHLQSFFKISKDDRLMQPDAYENLRNYFIDSNYEFRKILIYGPFDPWLPKDLSSCPIRNCIFTNDRTHFQDADVVLLTDRDIPSEPRPANQIWALYSVESPVHSSISEELTNQVNYTITYRQDSTIVASYGFYKPYTKDPGPMDDVMQQIKQLNAHKNKQVVWVVSNCATHSPRMEYVIHLSKYIDVDIYGGCGFKTCARRNYSCFEQMKRAYRFYLSFENSLCQDYVTEKFFLNSLQFNMIPIVMGATIEEYRRIAPPHSFIHVDEFESPQKLAQYLMYLSQNVTAYNAYFEWKRQGYVSGDDPYPQCQICLMAHSTNFLKPHWYEQAGKWWYDGCRDRTIRWQTLN